MTLRGKVPSLKDRVGKMLGLRNYKKRSTESPLFEALGESHISCPIMVRSRKGTCGWRCDHCHFLGDGSLGCRAAPVQGRKFYLLQDYETFKTGKSDEVSATYDLPLKKIAVSDYIARMLAEHHGIEDVSVVPNAVDCTQFHAPPRHKGPGLTVGFLYTGKPRKNVALAIDVLTRARESIPGLQAVAFGSIAPLESLPLPEWVRYHRTPPQEELAQLYASCDVWLFTSEHEGLRPTDPRSDGLRHAGTGHARRGGPPDRRRAKRHPA